MQKEETKLIISNNPPFNKLAEDEINKLVEISEIKEYKNGEIIYNQGDQPDFLYLLLKGRVMVSVLAENKDSEIEIIKRGTCFGIISLLTDEPHSVTTKSIETSFIIQITNEDFKKFLDNNPYLALDFSRTLSQRVKGRFKPKRIFQSKKIGIIGVSASGKTTFMFNLAKEIKNQTKKEIVCIQIIPSAQASFSDKKRGLLLNNFSETTLYDYIKKGSIDSLCVIADSSRDFASIINFLSESYHFILYEIPYSFSELDRESLIEPAQNLHYLIFPKKGALKESSNAIKNLIKQNPVNREKIKVILAEFPVDDQLSFVQKNSLLEHPIEAVLSSQDSLSYQATLRRLARQIGEVTIGVALGSGAAYGYAHIGVLKTLAEAKIPIDIICGSSMGAVIAALWATGFSISDIENYSTEVGKGIGSFSLFGLSIPFQGIMKAKRLESIFKKIFGNLTFYDLKQSIKVVTFDFKRRETVVLEEGLIYEALAASCAFPGIFEPVCLKKDIFLDGGILNPLPTKILLQYGAHKIIASNITLSQEQALSEYAKRDKFHIFDFIFGSIETMQQHFVRQAIELADVTIHSNLEGLGWTEFNKIDEFIARGQAAAQDKLTEIKKLTSL
ncbi:MAG: patatin-like phospholipase family protein [Candidatus Omnitrophica bacterium]|nr:patatin-like phospholipase family protein [Candidatus Omnitrophota bacterium]